MSQVKVIYPEGVKHDDVIYRSTDEAEAAFAKDPNFEIDAIYPDDGTEIVITLKFRIYKAIILSHGTLNGKKATLPKHVKLVFHCAQDQLLATDTMYTLMGAICQGAQGHQEINAGQEYQDLILKHDKGGQFKAHLMICSNNTKHDFQDGSTLSNIVKGLDTGYLWELHVIACRASSAQAPVMRTHVYQCPAGKRIVYQRAGGGCQAYTKQSIKCKRHAKKGRYCYQHQTTH